MNDMKHTPGPWSVPHFAKPDVNCECGYVLTDGYMGAVATVHCSGEGHDWKAHGDNPRFEEAVANAHLIAAAPALIEALREAEACMSIVAPRSDTAEYVRILGVVRAAIASVESGK